MKEDGLDKKIVKNRKFSISKDLILFIIVVILFVLFSLMSEDFFSYSNLTSLLKNLVVASVVAIGLTPLMISRRIDVSFGSNISLTSVIIALLFASGLNLYLAIFIGILLSVFCAFLNGLLIETFNLTPIITTLGTMSIYYALALVLTKGNLPIAVVSDDLIKLAYGFSLKLPTPVWFLVVVFLVYYFVLNFTVVGRRIYLIGANPLASYSVGIKNKKIRMILYTFFGLTVGIGTVILMGITGTGKATLGMGLLLPVLSGILVGGIGITGGSGSVLGTFLGILLISTIFNGLTLMGVTPSLVDILRGLLLIVIVSFYEVIYRKPTK